MSTTNNLNYFFFQEYYQGVNWSKVSEISFEEKNKDLCNFICEESFIEKLPKSCNVKEFVLLTTYPGLLIGTGLSHEIGSKSEIKLGFTFDYVTGMPFIPGSSIKGLLRSAFTLADGEYIKEKIEELNISNPESIDIKKLEYSIFGPRTEDHESDVNGTDIFLDAFITENNGETFLDLDYITPHHSGESENNLENKVPDGMANPIPLSFVKIKPGISFKFQFIVQDIEGIITADEKIKLFESIILDLGIGAKTNVGYGAMESKNSAYRQTSTKLPKAEVPSLLVEKRPKPKDLCDDKNIQIGKVYIGIVDSVTSFGAFVKISNSNCKGVLYRKNIFDFEVPENSVGEYLKKGQKIYVKVLSKNERGYQFTTKGIE